MYAKFKSLSDGAWLALLKRPIVEQTRDGVKFPGFPGEATQALFTIAAKEEIAILKVPFSRINSFIKLKLNLALFNMLNFIKSKKSVRDNKVGLESFGTCPICEKKVKFVAQNAWLRDNFFCTNCWTIPRERALMQVIQLYYPNWQKLTIHESSPSHRGASLRMEQEAATYIKSQWFPDTAPGVIKEGFRCENLEKLTFDDNSIDLHISQDVMEHVHQPAKAFQEIARTLKPGGAHIFTVPLVNKMRSSKLRARATENGQIEHIEQPMYHGNPIDPQGSLVTMDWGYDIVKQIFEASGLFTYLIYIDDISKGIRAEYIEVLVTVKPMDCGTVAE